MNPCEYGYMLNDTEYKEKFEDTKPQIQGQTMQWLKEKGQKDLQNITQKAKYQATQVRLKNGVNSDAPEGWAVSVESRRVTLVVHRW